MSGLYSNGWLMLLALGSGFLLNCDAKETLTTNQVAPSGVPLIESPPPPQPTDVLGLPAPKPSKDLELRLLPPKPSEDSQIGITAPKPSKDLKIRITPPKPPENSQIRVTPSKPPEDLEIRVTPPKPPEDLQIRVNPSKPPEDSQIRVTPPKPPEDSQIRVTPSKPPEEQPQLVEPPKKTSYSEICSLIVDEKSRSVPDFHRDELKTRMLDAHNRHRKLFDVSPLAWSDELAAYAQTWANYLRENHGCAMHHRFELNRKDGQNFGENLAYVWTSATIQSDKIFSTPEAVLTGWNAECEDFNLEQNTCKENKQCGHFTQALWDTTQRVGCAVAACNAGDPNYSRGGRTEIWVCNYDPAGNMTLIKANGERQKLKPFSLPKNASAQAPTAEENRDVVSAKMPSIVLYGNPDCGLCKASERLLNENKIPYEFKNLFADTNLLMKLHQENPKLGQVRFPYVYIDGVYRGGLNELQEMITSGSLKALP